jgi:hypothetical protein
LFRRVVITLIAINAIILGLDTCPYIHAAYGQSLWLVDRNHPLCVRAGVGPAVFCVQSSRGVFPHVMDEVLPQMQAAWIYFVSFILIATFVGMNFLVCVIVNNLQAVEIEERDDIAEIRKALARVEAQLQSSRDAEASEER